MRHKVKGRKLGRSTPHRKATMQALSVALIKNQRIKTTVAKAKELRRYIEPIITTAKVDSTHNRRKAFAFLQDKEAVTELFDTVGPAAKDRPGGYTRVLKLGFRLGDSAEMAMIELVDFNDVPPELKADKKKKTRRAGKSNKPTSAAPETESKKEEKKTKPSKKKEVESSSDDAQSPEVTDKDEAKASEEVKKQEEKKESPKAEQQAEDESEEKNSDK